MQSLSSVGSKGEYNHLTLSFFVFHLKFSDMGISHACFMHDFYMFGYFIRDGGNMGGNV